ncbi:MAG: hypothetical protein AAFO91_11995, partial [Bacteroidota bacterium]
MPKHKKFGLHFITAARIQLVLLLVLNRFIVASRQWKKDTKSAIGNAFENFSGINFSVEKLFPQFFCHQGVSNHGFMLARRFSSTDNVFVQTLQYCADVIELLADMLTSKSSIVKRYFGAKMNRALLVKLFDMLTVLDERSTENGGSLIFFCSVNTMSDWILWAKIQ